MLDKMEIEGIILRALKNLNDERKSNEHIEVSLSTNLFGAEAVLDSLSLVWVIVDVETALSEKSGHDISLTDDRAVSQKSSPFTNGNTLTAYIEVLVSELE